MRKDCRVVVGGSWAGVQVGGGAEKNLIDLRAVFPRLDADSVGAARAEHDVRALASPVPGVYPAPSVFATAAALFEVHEQGIAGPDPVSSRSAGIDGVRELNPERV